jgi:hypothetical protein
MWANAGHYPLPVTIDGGELLMLTNSYFYASMIHDKGPKKINQQ